ncbi:MAG TPA: glycosyltransferase family 39 protein [Terriglobales bacterium]|nr:glycosyltransferase family 39 protein [Terriglobales bacterium]
MGRTADVAKKWLLYAGHRARTFALIFTALFLLHSPLLRLPYFWDEAGYFVPAARDLLLTGDPIPQSTLSNAHPPLVMAYLALWWKLSGLMPAVTRTAMLLVAALALVGVHRLARQVANAEVAAAATVVTALYPVFFMQSVMAHLDLAAMALTMWALSFYVERRMARATLLFALAALAKETAIVAPLALAGWQFLRRAKAPHDPEESRHGPQYLLLLLAAVPLALWFEYHRERTGYLFGNPEYVRYNLLATFDPLRMALAALRRLWQAFGHQGLWALTLAGLLAMFRRPLREGDQERPRIALGTQMTFAVVIAAYVAAFSVAGGAVLARYMLPAVPLVVIVWVSTLRRRLRHWRALVATVAAVFVAAMFLQPPVPFSPEDSLAWRDYVLMHKRAADYLSQRYSLARVLTAWPGTDELTRPYLGYARIPLRVIALRDFSPPQMAIAARNNALYDVALLFSTKPDPPQNLLRRFPQWERWETHFFDYHRDPEPESAAALLGGHIVYQERRGGQWVAVIEIGRVQNASVREIESLNH